MSPSLISVFAFLGCAKKWCLRSFFLVLSWSQFVILKTVRLLFRMTSLEFVIRSITVYWESNCIVTTLVRFKWVVDSFG